MGYKTAQPSHPSTVSSEQRTQRTFFRSHSDMLSDFFGTGNEESSSDIQMSAMHDQDPQKPASRSGAFARVPSLKRVLDDDVMDEDMHDQNSLPTSPEFSHDFEIAPVRNAHDVLQPLSGFMERPICKLPVTRP